MRESTGQVEAVEDGYDRASFCRQLSAKRHDQLLVAEVECRCRLIQQYDRCVPGSTRAREKVRCLLTRPLPQIFAQLRGLLDIVVHLHGRVALNGGQNGAR